MLLLDYRIYKIIKVEKEYKVVEDTEKQTVAVEDEAAAEEETTGRKAAKKCGFCLEITLFVFLTIVLLERATLLSK